MHVAGRSTSQVKLILPQHHTRLTKMSAANRQDLSSALTIISANVEGFTAVQAGLLSGMCKVGNCHCLCLQETHIHSVHARPKVPGMTLIAERPHKKHRYAIFVRDDPNVNSVSIRDKGNVDLITVELPCVVLPYVYKAPIERFVLPALRHSNLPHIVTATA